MDVSDLGQKPWEFSNSQGVLSRSFWLLPDGRVGGYNHYNERAWRVVDGTIELIREDGSVSCVLEKIENSTFIEFKGRVLGIRDVHFHSIKRPKPKVGVFLRTHYWDPNVEKTYRKLKDVWSGDLLICVDVTNGAEIPKLNTVPHTENTLTRIGLPDLKASGSMIWYNGDYPLYDIALKTDYDIYVLCEFDCFVNCSIDDIVDRYISEKIDFSAPHLFEASDLSWLWEKIQRESDLVDYNSDKLPVHGCIFPFTIASREAILYLYARRLTLARNRASRAPAGAWPFCESFVPSELTRAGFHCAPLEALVGHQEHITVYKAWSWREIEDCSSEVSFVHPVLSGTKLVNKLVQYAYDTHGTDAESIATYLKSCRDRNFFDDEKAFLEEKITELENS